MTTQETVDDVIARVAWALNQKEKARESAQKLADDHKADADRYRRELGETQWELARARRWARRWKAKAKEHRTDSRFNALSWHSCNRDRVALRNRIAELEAALARWHRANETPDFQAADDALAELAARCAEDSYANLQ